MVDDGDFLSDVFNPVRRRHVPHPRGVDDGDEEDEHAGVLVVQHVVMIGGLKLLSHTKWTFYWTGDFVDSKREVVALHSLSSFETQSTD